MKHTNRHGLSRYIPAPIRREVRKNSKFGCVLCRRGFFQYEHIDPPFEDASDHHPDRICCLCGSCHDAVTRGQTSKRAVRKAYEAIRTSAASKVQAPSGPLDFHSGRAVLEFGDLEYSPAVRNVLRFNGQTVMAVKPSNVDDEPGAIDAIFMDSEGNESLRLEDNAWIGPTDAWDIEVEGPRLTVRRSHGDIVLELEFQPPGRIKINRLDMRINDSHVLVSSGTYAVGRYISANEVCWVHAQIQIEKSLPTGCAIEFVSPQELEQRDRLLKNVGKSMAVGGGDVVIHSNAGILVKPLGIAIGGLTGAFSVANLAIGTRSLDKIREVIRSHPLELNRFIATGDTVVSKN